METPTVRRTLVHLRDGAAETLLTLEVLMDGRVRLRLPAQEAELYAGTLEDLLRAAVSDADGEAYAALLWELDLLTLRGDSGRLPG